MLTIYIDFKSAASYLALGPTVALIEETGIAARWLPFPSRPFKIPKEQPDETVGDRHRRVRAIAQRDTYLHYADVQGLDMQFSQQAAGSNSALIAMAALQGDPLPFMRAAFQSYWTESANLDDASTVTQLLGRCGHQEPHWPAAQEAFEIVCQTAETRKIFETPTYLIGGQVFVGREHLPWIRSIITDSAVQAHK